jgi:hypothetical protein
MEVETWPEMTLNYWMISKLNGVVEGSIPSHAIVSLLDGKLVKWSSTYYIPPFPLKQKKKGKLRLTISHRFQV